MGPVGSMRALASSIVGRSSWLREAGVTFGGKRNLYEALGYKKILTVEDFRARFERNGVAGRIVDAMPLATWRGDGELVEDEDPKTETAFEKAWDELNTRLSVWSIFTRADILAGIGRYAIILIGAPGELSEPLEKCSADDLMYLTPFAEDDALISTWETDEREPRFGLPLMYRLSRTTAGPTRFSKMAHWTRCIHVADGLLDDHVYGSPRLLRPWNLLDDLEKVTGGGAEAFWKRADQGLQLDIDPEIKFTGDDLKKLEEEVEEYVHGLRRIIRSRGVTMNPLGSDVANFGPPAASIIDQISAATGIPQRILTGSERGELASGQDKTQWDDRVSDRRLYYAGPMIVRPFVDRLIGFGALPEPEHYEPRWPHIKNLNEVQKADVATKWSTLNTQAGETVVTGSEIRDRVLELPPFTDEQKVEIKKKADEAAAAAAAAAPPPPEPAKPAKPNVTAAAQALSLAILSGKRALDVPELRAALGKGDRAQVEVLLRRSSEMIAQTLREAVPQLTEG